MALVGFDPAKNDENRRKHGIDLEQFGEMDLSSAVAVEGSRRDYGETRLRVLGLHWHAVVRRSNHAARRQDSRHQPAPREST